MFCLGFWITDETCGTLFHARSVSNLNQILGVVLAEIVPGRQIGLRLCAAAFEGAFHGLTLVDCVSDVQMAEDGGCQVGTGLAPQKVEHGNFFLLSFPI